jgi:hypothetical protein
MPGGGHTDFVDKLPIFAVVGQEVIPMATMNLSLPERMKG